MSLDKPLQLSYWSVIPSGEMEQTASNALLLFAFGRQRAVGGSYGDAGPPTADLLYSDAIEASVSLRQLAPRATPLCRCPAIWNVVIGDVTLLSVREGRTSQPACPGGS